MATPPKALISEGPILQFAGLGGLRGGSSVGVQTLVAPSNPSASTAPLTTTLVSSTNVPIPPVAGSVT